MHVKIHIVDILCLAAIGATCWWLDGKQVGHTLWVGLGVYGVGRFSQWAQNA